MFEKYHPTNAHNILYTKKFEICLAYVSNSLNDPKKEKDCWHYLSIKKLSTLLREITSKNNFYCLNCLNFF